MFKTILCWALLIVPILIKIIETRRSGRGSFPVLRLKIKLKPPQLCPISTSGKLLSLQVATFTCLMSGSDHKTIGVVIKLNHWLSDKGTKSNQIASKEKNAFPTCIILKNKIKIMSDSKCNILSQKPYNISRK